MNFLSRIVRFAESLGSLQLISLGIRGKRHSFNQRNQVDMKEKIGVQFVDAEDVKFF